MYATATAGLAAHAALDSERTTAAARSVPVKKMQVSASASWRGTCAETPANCGRRDGGVDAEGGAELLAGRYRRRSRMAIGLDARPP